MRKVKRCVPLIKACPKIPPASLLPNPVKPDETEAVDELKRSTSRVKYYAIYV